MCHPNTIIQIVRHFPRRQGTSREYFLQRQGTSRESNNNNNNNITNRSARSDAVSYNRYRRWWMRFYRNRTYLYLIASLINMDFRRVGSCGIPIKNLQWRIMYLTLFHKGIGWVRLCRYDGTVPLSVAGNTSFSGSSKVAACKQELCLYLTNWKGLSASSTRLAQLL